jgi:alkanesulfonate monooxygenase SsuD/methylene tetrahydromethanopterin reductase-like flavin-dependent oxidoreductase (luciferase family)
MDDNTDTDYTNLDTDDGVRLGVLLPTGSSLWGDGVDPRRLVEFAVRVERLGYASVWANDSLSAPRIETLTMLAAAATATHRVTLGTATLLPVLRRPLQAAQTIASVDLLSGGRLVVGVGAGFPGPLGQPMHRLSEVPWRGRFARLDETVVLWRQLWAADRASSFHGDVLHFDDLPPATTPYRAGGPPIWLGGAAPAALARVGRHYDGWLPYPPDVADYATGLATVRQAAVAAGRGSATIAPALFVTVRLADDVETGRRALDEFSRTAYGLPLAQLEAIQAVVTGPAESVVAALGDYVRAGARHVVCRLGAVDLPTHLDQLDRLAELLPALATAAAGQSTPADDWVGAGSSN